MTAGSCVFVLEEFKYCLMIFVMGHSADIDTENAVKCGNDVNMTIHRSFSCLFLLGTVHVQQEK